MPPKRGAPKVALHSKPKRARRNPTETNKHGDGDGDAGHQTTALLTTLSSVRKFPVVAPAGHSLQDLGRLERGEMLDDDTLNCILQLLIDIRGGGLDILVMRIAFFQDICAEPTKSSKKGLSKQCKATLIPICIESHWLLVVVRALRTNRSVFFCDLLSPRST